MSVTRTTLVVNNRAHAHTMEEIYRIPSIQHNGIICINERSTAKSVRRAGGVVVRQARARVRGAARAHRVGAVCVKPVTEPSRLHRQRAANPWQV